jgi:geranylgeranyl pyrophosphate synthase
LDFIQVAHELSPDAVACARPSLMASGCGAFCYWGWRAAGQPDSDAMIKAAAAMELVHAASVVHDDIIDRSLMRRNSPCAHIALRDAITGAETRAAGGIALAMMLGDLLISLSGLLFSDCGLPGSYLQRAGQPGVQTRHGFRIKPGQAGFRVRLPAPGQA